MARRERLSPRRTVAAPWLATMVAACLPLTWAAAADPHDEESLEPAKEAVRVRDYATAIRLLTADADRGDARERYLLGSLQLAGLGTPVDRSQARASFEASARAGHARAAYAIAAVLAQDSPDERAAALHWLERAAELGDARARDAWSRHALPLDFDLARDLPDETSRREAAWQAATRNDRGTLEALLDSTRIHATDAFGRTGLHRAAEAGALGSIDLLLGRGAAVTAVDQYGVTPLMLACAAEPAAACQRLLQAGADVTAADRAGHTAVWYAARQARAEQERGLLAAGASPVTKPNVLPRQRPPPLACHARAQTPMPAGRMWPSRRRAAIRRHCARCSPRERTLTHVRRTVTRRCSQPSPPIRRRRSRYC